MPAGPLEHRCWAEGAAGGQEKAQQWLTAALAAGMEQLVPELGAPLQLSAEWIRREKGKAKRTVGCPPTSRLRGPLVPHALLGSFWSFMCLTCPLDPPLSGCLCILAPKILLDFGRRKNGTAPRAGQYAREPSNAESKSLGKHTSWSLKTPQGTDLS